MFGFFVLFALLLAMSLGFVLRTQGPQRLYTKVRNDHEALIVQAIFVVLATGMASIIIYDKFWLEIILPSLHKLLRKLELNITSDDMNLFDISLGFFLNITERIYQYCWPKLALYSILIGRFMWPWYSTSAEIDELLCCLVFPGAIGVAAAAYVDRSLDWPFRKTVFRFAWWLLPYAKSYALVALSCAVATAKDFCKYIRATDTILKLAAENTDLKSKMERLESAHSEAVQREASAILTIALLGKELNDRGERIIFLEDTTRILKHASETWYQEYQKADYQAQLGEKIAVIGRLRAQIRQRDKYEVDLEDQIEELRKAVKTGSAVKNNSAVKEPLAREAELVNKVRNLQAEIEVYRRKEKQAAMIANDAPKSANDDVKARQELAGLKDEKKALQDRVSTLEKQATKAEKKTQELQHKTNESTAESSKRIGALRNDLATRTNALEEKTEAHSKLAQMHSQCPIQDEFQDLVAEMKASKERETAISTELQRLSNIEKEKNLAEQNAADTAHKLQQAEVTIATQQKLLQNRNTTTPEQATISAEQDTAALQQLAGAKTQVAFLQNEVQRLSNMEQEKLATDDRAARAAQQLQQATATTSRQMQQMQQAEIKFTEQQASLNQATQRIQELESQVQDATQRATTSDECAGALQAQIVAAKNTHEQDKIMWTKLKSNYDKDHAADQGSIRRLQQEINEEREVANKELSKRNDQIRMLRTSSNMTTTHQQDREELRLTNVKYSKCLKRVNALERELDQPCTDCGKYEQELRILTKENERLEDENEEMAEELNVNGEEFEVDFEVSQLNFRGLRGKCMQLKADNKGLHSQVGMWKEQYKRKEVALQSQDAYQGDSGAEVRMLKNQLQSTQEALDDQMQTNETLQQQLDVVLGPRRPEIGGESDEGEEESSLGDEYFDKSEYDDEVDYGDD